MGKHMCDWKGRVEHKLDTFCRIVGKPRYACKKCARVAATREWLCKPVCLPAPEE